MRFVASSIVAMTLAFRSASAFAPATIHPTRAAATSTSSRLAVFGTKADSKYPVMADEAVMSPKTHGTSEKPVQEKLRWNCDFETADRICNFNRHYAEFAGYWATTDFLKNLNQEETPIKFYDSVTGKLLFTAPVGRSMEDFIKESQRYILFWSWPFYTAKS